MSPTEYPASSYAAEEARRLLARMNLVVVDPSASAADIATQLPGYVVLRADVATTLIRTLRDAGLYGIADQIEAQTRRPEPPPVSNEEAARLIKTALGEGLSDAGITKLLRFADQLSQTAGGSEGATVPNEEADRG